MDTLVSCRYHCSCSVTESCLTLCGLVDCSQGPLSSTISWGLLKFMSIELVVLSNHLILCHLLLLLPAIFPSIGVFSNELAAQIGWPKYWSCFSISLSNEYSGIISFRMDWFDLLAVPGTLKSLLQKHNLKAAILRHPFILLYGKGNGNPLQYSCLEYPMDGGAW